MSEMEMCVCRFEEADDQTIFPTDDDDFYEMEKEQGCSYVRVNGKVFKFWSVLDVDYYSFQTTLPAQDGPIILAAWYNGGAGIHEVVEATIKELLNDLQSD